MPFTIQKEDSIITFDVADLRKKRPELYELLQMRLVMELYWGHDMKKIVTPSLPRQGDWPKDEDERQRLIKFFLMEATEALEELSLACGSFADGMAAELSLIFTQDESTRLAEIVADPLHEKFLVFMLKTKSGHKLSKELTDHIYHNLLPAFRANLIARCKNAGVAEEICTRFKTGPLPQ